MKTAIIGAGIWGTAIANLVAHNSHYTCIFTRNSSLAKTINEEHINPRVPYHVLPASLTATTELSHLKAYNLIFVCIPSQDVRQLFSKAKQYIGQDTTIVLCSKGIETNSLLLPSEVIQEYLPTNDILFLSGPNFATEVLSGTYSFANLSGQSIKNIDIIQQLSSNTFFVKNTNDIIGAQVMAAFKNVIAILCGLLSTLKSGRNTLSAVISASINQARLFIEAKHGNPDTASEFCCMGDLILTCTSEQSRNFLFGNDLVSGQHKEVLVEGVSTLHSLQEMNIKYQIKCPLIQTLFDIISYERSSDYENKITHKLSAMMTKIINI